MDKNFFPKKTIKKKQIEYQLIINIGGGILRVNHGLILKVDFYETGG